MNRPEPKNLPASIHQRLLNSARASGRPFDELLRYYSIERFLYRLSCSPHRDHFVLKGALIFSAWGTPLGRSTRDVDLLAFASNVIEEIVPVFQSVCLQKVEIDAMDFDPATVSGERITEHADYQGIRVRFQGHLGRARVRMQVDLAFADVVSPRPELVQYPSMLGMPRPVLRGYPRETVVAEKTQALVMFGMLNRRMKDFYDLWLLAHHYDFDGPPLSLAIVSTFSRRNTSIPVEMPEGLLEEFGQLKQEQWVAFLRTSEVTGVPRNFGLVLKELRRFLMPVLQSANQKQPILEKWAAPGPWQALGAGNG